MQFPQSLKQLYIIKRRLAAVAISSVLIILLAAFEWSIWGRFSFILSLFLSPLVWLAFVISAIAGITCILKFKEIKMLSLVPLGISIASFLIVMQVPFTDIWLKANFAFYKQDREKIVAKVQNDEFVPATKYYYGVQIALGDEYPLVSADGNEINVEEHKGGKYVYFYTFKGILDNYSGFLYVPDGGDFREYYDLSDKTTRASHFGGNWYFVSHT